MWNVKPKATGEQTEQTNSEIQPKEWGFLGGKGNGRRTRRVESVRYKMTEREQISDDKHTTESTNVIL